MTPCLVWAIARSLLSRIASIWRRGNSARRICEDPALAGHVLALPVATARNRDRLAISCCDRAVYRRVDDGRSTESGRAPAWRVWSGLPTPAPAPPCPRGAWACHPSCTTRDRGGSGGRGKSHGLLDPPGTARAEARGSEVDGCTRHPLTPALSPTGEREGEVAGGTSLIRLRGATMRGGWAATVGGRALRRARRRGRCRRR